MAGHRPWSEIRRKSKRNDDEFAYEPQANLRWKVAYRVRPQGSEDPWGPEKSFEVSAPTADDAEDTAEMVIENGKIEIEYTNITEV